MARSSLHGSCRAISPMDLSCQADPTPSLRCKKIPNRDSRVFRRVGLWEHRHLLQISNCSGQRRHLLQMQPLNRSDEALVWGW
jgi:hypothetical protein